MKYKKVLILIITIFTHSCFSVMCFAEMENTGINKEIYGEINEKQEEDVFGDIEAPNLLLGEVTSERILYGRNINDRLYPASITKLMTAIIVVENCELDEVVTVSENAVKSVPLGYVNANLQVGEELTVEDLLYVMLIEYG